MKASTMWWICLCGVMALLSLRPASAATAEDFGFGNITVNGKPVSGSIPLLVVTFEFATNGTTRLPLIPNANNVFDQLIFNFFSVPSVNGYFLENSYGSFSWQRAAVIGPVTLDATETATLDAKQSTDTSDGIMRTGMDCGAGIAYLLERTASKTGYNFAQWDANANGTITQDELSIMVIGNNGQFGGANRPIGAAGAGQAVPDQAVPGQSVTLQGRVASLAHRTSFMTMTHELSHSVGTADLYAAGCFSSGLTLMSCTIVPPDDDRRTFHLDPWHKMRLGWLRPRVFTLGSGGVVTLAASPINSPNTPIILYDPLKGMTEYFIVEFRSNQLPGADHDTNLTDQRAAVPFTGVAMGMAVWHVAPGNPPVFHEGAPNLAAGGSTLWNGQMTPRLQWINGTATATMLNPGAIISGGTEMVIEWTTIPETWVDFDYVGTENGSFANPFNTLAEGVAAASPGGILKIKAGSSSERPTLTKRLNLEAAGGSVTIGN